MIKNKQSQEIIATQTIETAMQTPEKLIAQAIEKGTPIETIERLLNMRRELKAEWAKEEFDKAMANFQGECPIIKKTKAGGQTKSGIVAYHYAPLPDIINQVKELLRKNGFSYTIKTQTLEKGVKVSCISKHISGHSELSDVEVPLGRQTEVMSSSQVVASALTFAKRYAFCNAFGILTSDDDNDGATDNSEQSLNKSFELIKVAKDVKILENYKDKIMDSKKYTEQQKNSLIDAITIRIDELV